MSISAVDNSQLDQLLLSFMGSTALTSNRHFFPLFHTLYHHGFRVRELEKCNEWIDQGNGLILCKTSKGSADRFILSNELDPLILQSIASGTNLVWKSSYTTYKRFFQRNKGVLNFYVNGADISTHIFRHNRIKKLADQGKALSEIKAIMGLISDTVTINYIDSAIEVRQV